MLVSGDSKQLQSHEARALKTGPGRIQDAGVYGLASQAASV